MRRFVLITLGFLIFLPPAMSAADPILGMEPEPSSRRISPLPHAQKLSDSLSSPSLADYQVKLRIQLGTAFDSYSLSGTGFNASLPVKRSGLLWGGEAEYRLDSSPIMLFGRLRGWSTNYTSISLVTPSTIDVTKRIYTVGAAYFPWDELFAFSMGLTFQTRDATETSPNATVTSVQKYGFEFGAIYEKPISEDFIFGSRASLFFPVYYNELFKNTGYYLYSLSAEGNISISYSVSHIVSLAVRLWARHERAEFKGTGLRGVTDGRESELSFGIPLEVQISF
jgi:hypothetical protein